MEIDRLNQIYRERYKEYQEKDAARLHWTPEEVDVMARICAVDEVIGVDKEGHPEELALREEIMKEDAFQSGFLKLVVCLKAAAYRGEQLYKKHEG